MATVASDVLDSFTSGGLQFDFSFAFNVPTFSDRSLKLQVTDTCRQAVPDGGENEKNEAAVIKLLVAADKYGVHSCLQACVENLKKKASAPFSEAEAVQVAVRLAPLHHESLKPIIAASQKRLVRMVGDMLKKMEQNHAEVEGHFTEIPLEALTLVLRADDLEVEKEDTVCTAVLEWVRHSAASMEERRSLMCSLMQYMRLPFVSPDYIKTTLAVADECKTDASRDLLFQSLLYRSGSVVEHGKTLSSFTLSVSSSSSLSSSSKKTWMAPRTLQASPSGETFMEYTLEELAGGLRSPKSSSTLRINGMKFQFEVKRVENWLGGNLEARLSVKETDKAARKVERLRYRWAVSRWKPGPGAEGGNYVTTYSLKPSDAIQITPGQDVNADVAPAPAINNSLFGAGAAPVGGFAPRAAPVVILPPVPGPPVNGAPAPGVTFGIGPFGPAPGAASSPGYVPIIRTSFGSPFTGRDLYEDFFLGGLLRLRFQVFEFAVL
eukprot:jgi/Mesen1/10278/ME000789S09555